MSIRATLGRVLLIVPLLAAALALGWARPAAAAYTCTESTRPAPGSTIRDSIVVPPGESCELGEVTVRGGVTVAPGARIATFRGEIRGALTIDGAALILINGTVVRGPLSVTNSSPTSFFIEDSEIRGDLVLIGNTIGEAQYIEVVFNEVRGNLIFSNNTLGRPETGSSFANIAGNAISQDLICEGNNHTPRLGSNPPNSVRGSATSQCAGLV